MTQFLSYLLTLLLVYGYPIVALAVLLGSIGVPLPVTSVLLAAGSFSADGTLNIFFLVFLVCCTAMIGDLVMYWLGRKVNDSVLHKYRRWFGLSEKKLDVVTTFFENWGGGSIFLTRWLVTPLCVPVSILAGLQRYSLRKFFLVSLLGNIVWASLYLSLGYIFGTNWQALEEYIDNAPVILALLVLSWFLLWTAKKLQRLLRKGKSFHY